MYLKRISIHGFKSFSKETILEFPAPNGNKGITAIIGPNGSGKSNIADAIRWVLGEQSLKLLRGKKAEDVIFSGSQKSARLGRAEVCITLDNENKQAGAEYEYITLTRRVYRNGESEYLLNGAPTKLSDIIILLAQANVGQKNYAVIGQGMIDHILLASPVERKDFFDEATGIKQHQIKRDHAARTLERTSQALEDTRIVLQEIEPRLKLLEKQAKRWEQREEIAQQLFKLEQTYYGNIWHTLTTKILLQKNIEQELKIKQKKIAHLQENLQKQFDALTVYSQTSDFSLLQREQKQTQKTIDELRQEQMRLKQRYERQLEIRGQGDAAWMYRRISDIQNEVQRTEQTIAQYINEQTHLTLIINEKKDEASVLREKIAQQREAMKRMEAILQTISFPNLLQEINAFITDHDSLLQSEKNIQTLKQKLAGIIQKLKSLARTLQPRSTDSQELLQEQQVLERLHTQNDTITQYIHNYTIEQNIVSEKLRITKEQYENLQKNITELNQRNKDAEGIAPIPADTLTKQLHAIDARLSKLIQSLLSMEQRMTEMHHTEEKRRQDMAKIQTEIKEAGLGLHEVEARLHDHQITTARLEQHKEDVDIEMKQFLSPALYSEILTYASHPNIPHIPYTATPDSLGPQIQRLRKQLEQIGEVEEGIIQEHKETSERFIFLSEQSKDMDTSLKHLRTIIHDLDAKIEKQFSKNFKQINEKFEHYFKILFGGGKAMLTYSIIEHSRDTETNDTPSEREASSPIPQGESGQGIRYQTTEIQISACPPNKKISTIAMLSGGERALTSIALICAIISANPAPFVVLDEVDAALDEPNSERFAAILEHLSHLTQFIAITHNRAVMHKANLLYGVTMTDDASSQLFSVNLETAKPHLSKPHS